MGMLAELVKLLNWSRKNKPPEKEVEPALMGEAVGSARPLSRRAHCAKKARRKNQRRMHRIAACRPTY
jgi:hypothetical protein